MRRRVTIIVALAAAVGAGLALAPAGHASVPVVQIDGRGFGHGVGMAQDGALAMGRAGATTNQILGSFYPGTGLGRASGAVRVGVLAPAAGPVVLSFPNGGDVRDALDGEQSTGFPVAVPPGGQVAVQFDGTRYVVEDTSGSRASAASQPSARLTVGAPSSPSTTAPKEATTTTAPTAPILPPATTSTTGPPSSTTTTTAVPPSPTPAAVPAGASSPRPLWAVPANGGTVTVVSRNRTYRGVLETLSAPGGTRLINQVDVEIYLRGMGEVRNPKWPPAALRAQAIAARTYALRAMGTAGELCDDQRCQVYLGAQAEYAAMNKAVSDTSRQVVVFGRGLASTVYSANGGGHSATRQEGFGTDGGTYPYLRAAPYLTDDPAPWSVQVALSDVAARFGYRGTIGNVTVGQAGPSGRALQVVLDGNAGARTVTGLSFAAGLGLRSSLFSVRVTTADHAPAPPPPGGPLQGLPEQAAVADAPVAAASVPETPSLPPLYSPPFHPPRTSPAGQRELAGLGLMLNVGAAGAVVGRRLRATRA